MSVGVRSQNVQARGSVDRRSLRLWLGWGAGLGVATLVVHLYDPNISGSYGYCPLRWATGWLCPFCGATRAAHAVTHGEWAAALALNPLFVIAIPGVILLWLYAVWRALRGSGTDYFVRASTFWWVLATLAVFAGLRNISYFAPYLSAVT